MSSARKIFSLAIDRHPSLSVCSRRTAVNAMDDLIRDTAQGFVTVGTEVMSNTAGTVQKVAADTHTTVAKLLVTPPAPPIRSREILPLPGRWQ